MDTLAFADEVERHDRWRREHLPGIDTAQGMSLLVWLLQNLGEVRAIDELNEPMPMARPEMQTLLDAFVGRGLAFARDDVVSGRRLIGATNKLVQLVREYRERVGRLAEQSRRVEEPPQQAVRTAGPLALRA